MDNRLVLTVLLVTLSWLSVGIYAQSNMTTTPGSMTTTPGSMTTTPGSMTTTPANNMTTTPGSMTTTPGNMTTTPGSMTTTPANNMTTTPGNMMTTTPGSMTTTPGSMTTTPANNMTTTPGNMMTTTPGSMTTTPGSMTTTPANNMTTTPGSMTTTPGSMTTTPANNMTTTPGSMTTTPGNMTTTPANIMTTTAPPVTLNITVENLETTLNRTGCGTEQLCAAEPASCNPAVAGSCFFLSARLTSGQNFEFGLAGEADGYIAATLSSDSTLGGDDATYVCANNNGTVAFFTAVLNNNMLTLRVLNVSNVRGRVIGNRIQCTFAAAVPDSASVTSRSARASSLALAISTGPFNSTSGTLGAPTPRLESPVVNLANPNTTIVNQVSNTTNATTASPTTMTTQAGNMTTAPVNMTTAPVNMTTAPVNMTAVVPPVPVENLETRLNRTGCGTEQLCAAEPATCNPAVEGSCFFLSARQTSGPNFDCGLSGQSDGYIAATLSSDNTLGGNDATYVCANNNGTVVFFSTFLNNNMLTVTTLNVSNVRGRVDGNTIQCTFGAVVPDPATSVSTRASNVTIAISTGTFNSTSNTLGAPETRLQSSVGNLANPNATIVNQVTNTTVTTTIAPTTASPVMTTSHAITLQQSLTHAMLIAASVLGLFML